MVVYHAQYAYIAPRRRLRYQRTAFEYGSDLVVVQPRFFEQFEVGDVIRHLQQL
jgi:hypothetical protein